MVVRRGHRVPDLEHPRPPIPFWFEGMFGILYISIVLPSSVKLCGCRLKGLY